MKRQRESYIYARTFLKNDLILLRELSVCLSRDYLTGISFFFMLCMSALFSRENQLDTIKDHFCFIPQKDLSCHTSEAESWVPEPLV